MKILPNNQPRIGFKFFWAMNGVTYTIIDDHKKFEWKLINNLNDFEGDIKKSDLSRALKNGNAKRR